MTVTYDHDPDNAFNNPAPPSHDALARVGMALEAAARGDGPLACASPADRHKSDYRLLSIMGSKLSPSPELHGAGAGVLDVDYADGITRTFDVDAQGRIAPRRYAYASAVVFESEAPLSEDQIDSLLDAISHVPEQAPDALAGVTTEWASTPRTCTYRPNDDYDVQPRDESAGGRNR